MSNADTQCRDAGGPGTDVAVGPQSWGPSGSGEQPLFNGLTVNQAIWLFLALGVAARLVRFALRFPLWEDEAALTASFIGASYGDLLKPLPYNQVSPLLFLWVELSMVRLFGFTEYSLRFFPVVCSIASLFVFRHLAGRLLRGWSLVLAVGIFCVAYPGIRSAAEVKPYSVDLLVSTVLLALTVQWLTSPQRNVWLWMLAGVAPLAVGLSFPSVFVGGAVSLAVAYVLWTRRTADGWLPWAAFSLLLAGSFVAMFLLSTGGQSAATAEVMTDHWQSSFPPLSKPLQLVGWFFATHTGYLLSYPIGGRNGGSTLTFICCAVALVLWWRKGWRSAIVLAIAPFVLNFVAAAMHRYPYGGHMRMTLHLAPIICILAAVGAEALLARLSVRRSTPFAAALVALCLIGLTSIGRDFWLPGKTREDIRAQAFSRQLWRELSEHGEVLCIGDEAKISPIFRSNRRIYWRAATSTAAPQLDRLSASWPLYCVRFKSTVLEADEAAFQQWLAAMGQNYELKRRDEHLFMPYSGLFTRTSAHRPPVKVHREDSVEIYSFVPKRALTREALSVATAISENRR